MPESYIGIDETTVDKKLHTWQRTIGANNVEDGFVLPGEYPLAAYTVIGQSVSTATAGAHLVEIMAGASNYVRIRRIRLRQVALPAAGAINRFTFVRLTSAGTGGTVVTPARLDNGDVAATATAMTLPTAAGTESTTLWTDIMGLTSTNPSTEVHTINWQQLPNSKPFIIPPGTSNGLAIRVGSGVATSAVDFVVEFVETSFL